MLKEIRSEIGKEYYRDGMLHVNSGRMSGVKIRSLLLNGGD